MCAVNVRCEWMLLNQLHHPRDLPGNEWECEVLLTHTSRVWFEWRCPLDGPKGNFLLIDLQLSILMEKKPSKGGTCSFLLEPEILVVFSFLNLVGSRVVPSPIICIGITEAKVCWEWVLKGGGGIWAEELLNLHSLHWLGRARRPETVPDDWTTANRRSGLQSPQPRDWGWESHLSLWTRLFIWARPVYCTSYWGLIWVIEVNAIWGSL